MAEANELSKMPFSAQMLEPTLDSCKSVRYELELEQEEHAGRTNINLRWESTVSKYEGLRNALQVHRTNNDLCWMSFWAENHMKIPIYNMRIKMPENCLVLEVCFYSKRMDGWRCYDAP